VAAGTPCYLLVANCDRHCGAVSAGHLPEISGLARIVEVAVPPNLAKSVCPYSASLPKLWVVTFGITLPKFQIQAPVLNSPLPMLWPFTFVSVQNG
jgi:hypothetical protein